MKRYFFKLFSVILPVFFVIYSFGQGQKGFSGYLKASLLNKNVYKTKVPLKAFNVYENNQVSALDSFIIKPEKDSNKKDTYIRYKVVTDEGDFKYIRVLPGCYIKKINDSTNHIKLGSSTTASNSNPENMVLKVSKKQLEPNAHYLASSAIIGKLITLPVRVRKEYWNEKNTVVQGALSLGMGFGWKFKFGNNPYKTKYLSVVVYGAGISSQKYFSRGGKDPSGKDSLTAKTDEFAVTYLSQGIAYEVERFNFGIFWGKDKMFGNLKNWVYQDKWWWGIGVGYELFK